MRIPPGPEAAGEGAAGGGIPPGPEAAGQGAAGGTRSLEAGGRRRILEAGGRRCLVQWTSIQVLGRSSSMCRNDRPSLCLGPYGKHRSIHP